MSRMTRRDTVIAVAFAAAAVFVSVFAFSGQEEWAIALLSVLVASAAIVSRVGFATRRRDIRGQRKELRDIKTDLRRARQQLKRGDDTHRRLVSALHADTRSAGALIADRAAEIDKSRRSDMEELQRQLLAGFRKVRIESNTISTMKDDLSADMVALRAELRGMRVAQQLMSQAVADTKTQTRLSVDATAAVADDVQGIHQLFGRYMPTAPLPGTTSSRLRATGSFFATNLIERMQPNVVRCVGAVSPALWIAYALRQCGRGALIIDVPTAAQASLARDLLAAHSLTEWAEVRLLHESGQLDIDRGDSGHNGSVAGSVDLLVLDEPGFSANRSFYPDARDLKLLLSEQATIVVAASDDSAVRDLLHEWSEAHECLSRTHSPRADIAVLAWDRGVATSSTVVSD